MALGKQVPTMLCILSEKSSVTSTTFILNDSGILYINEISKNNIWKTLAYPSIFSYLSNMKKDEIIELLKKQLHQANDTVSSLTIQVGELIERIKSLEEQLVQKGIAIDNAKRMNNALGKLVSGKKSERREKNPQEPMTQEEFDRKKKE